MSHLDLPGYAPGLRVIGLIGAGAMVAWAVAAAAQARAKRWRETAWAVSLLLISGATGLLGFAGPEWHVVGTGLVAGVALRNVVLCDGLPRWLTGAGLLTWLVALVKARLLAHG